LRVIGIEHQLNLLTPPPIRPRSTGQAVLLNRFNSPSGIKRVPTPKLLDIAAIEAGHDASARD
jgi:hypothetical protein